MNSADFSLNRRAALGGASALVLSSLAGTSVSAKGTPPLIRWQDPKYNLMTLARLEGGVTGRVTYGFSHGQVHGLRNGQGLSLTDYGKHLYDFIGVVIKRSRLRSDGAVETVSRSLLYYVDPESGAFLDSFVNPYTGETLPVKGFAGGIGGTLLTTGGTKMAASFAMESTVFNTPIKLQYVTVGDRTWIRRHAYTRWTPADHPRARTEMTLDSWLVNTRDLANGRLDRIPGSSSWTSQTDWQVWLKMPADYPGMLLWRSDGAEYDSISNLPSSFISRTRDQDPKFLSDPLEFPKGAVS